MTQAHTAFHWPDHVIGKRESRHIREEHNALYNSHADLLAALQFCITEEGATAERSHKFALQRLRAISEQARAAIDRATKG